MARAGTETDALVSSGPLPTVGEPSPRAKRAQDLILGSLLLVAASPVMVCIATLLALTGGGPVLFRHPRVGRQGKLFNCLKFRTMRPDADNWLRDLLAHDQKARCRW